MDICGTIAVVTGAARGIGLETALALARAGVGAIVLVDVRDEALSVRADVRDVGALGDVIRYAESRFGGPRGWTMDCGVAPVFGQQCG